MRNLTDLLLAEIKDLYSAEKQIVKALPKMIKGVKSEVLKTALSDHLEETKDQVIRLEQVFSHLGAKAEAKTCKGMEGVLAEGAECLEGEKEGLLRDLQIIGAAQRVEHYEMAAYGTARAMAEQLENSDITELLSDTFEEESAADEKLSEIAMKLYAQVDTEDSSQRVSDEDETVSAGMKPAPKRKVAAAASAR